MMDWLKYLVNLWAVLLTITVGPFILAFILIALLETLGGFLP